MPVLKVKYIALLLSVIGICLLCCATSLTTYTNKQDYFDKYELLHSSHDTEAFYKLREEYLTPKYRLQDYGLTLILLASGLSLVFHKGWQTYTPDKKSEIAIIGLVAVFSTTIAVVGDLFLDGFRGEFPWWADTLIIPLMSIPPLFAFLFIWFAIQLTGFFGTFKTNVPLSIQKFNGPVLLYAIQLVAMLVITVVIIFEGAFWFLAPAILWCAFFTYLLMGRGSTKPVSNKINDRRHFF
jgi:hypothetical protein